MIAQLENFTDNLDPAGDLVSTATEVSPAAAVLAAQMSYSQIKLSDLVKLSSA
ncbi:hypothetical protein [Kamptonema formosum]|uniref:hypothetical protein n=1 Tax=Kamptonema formosum TaxID=331992 RepID=UPI0003477F12|nr:hypothetical protein [Oscillatoria sp. PCC 10802]